MNSSRSGCPLFTEYPISDVFEALSRNNQNTGGSYIEKVNKAYYIRSEGMINELKDIERIVVQIVTVFRFMWMM